MDSQIERTYSGENAVRRAHEIFADYFVKSLERGSSRNFYDLPRLLGVIELEQSRTVTKNAYDLSINPAIIGMKLIRIFYLELMRAHYGAKGKKGCELYQLAQQFFAETDVLDHLPVSYLALYMVCQIRLEGGHWIERKNKGALAAVEEMLGRNDLDHLLRQRFSTTLGRRDHPLSLVTCSEITKILNQRDETHEIKFKQIKALMKSRRVTVEQFQALNEANNSVQSKKQEMIASNGDQFVLTNYMALLFDTPDSFKFPPNNQIISTIMEYKNDFYESCQMHVDAFLAHPKVADLILQSERASTAAMQMGSGNDSSSE